jgi:hypothetical protein
MKRYAPVNKQTPPPCAKNHRTARRYRTVQIRAGQHLLTAEEPLPADLRDTLAQPH